MRATHTANLEGVTAQARETARRDDGGGGMWRHDEAVPEGGAPVLASYLAARTPRRRPTGVDVLEPDRRADVRDTEQGSPHPASDAELIARSREAPSAFAAIFDRHYDAIRRFLWSRVGDRADDLAAETFRIAFERRFDYDLEYRSARPWLFGIAARLAKQRYRERTRVERLRARLAVHASDRDAVSDPEQRLHALAPSTPVASALMELEERDRDPLLLHVWDELSYEEIARVLDVPIGTVRSRIHRARATLRERLSAGDATWGGAHRG